MDTSMDNTEIKEYEYANKKLWNPKGFIFIGVIVSFIPAAVLYSLNYGRLGLKRERLVNLLGLGAIAILMLGISYYATSSIIRPLSYGLNIGLSIYMRNKQMDMYKNHIENGGKKASYLLPTLISLVVIGFLIWAMIYSINVPEKSIRVSDDELFYTERISSIEAKEVGSFLESIEFFGNDNFTINAGIDKTQKGYVFSLIVLDEAVDDEELDEYMIEVGNLLSQEVLDNQYVQLDLCDEQFNVLKTIR